MSSASSVDLAIVGGGISGLGLAHMAAREGVRPLLLESDERVGGALCSQHFELPQGTFWAEMGAHTCYNSYGNLLQILEDAGQLDSLLAKQKLSYRFLTPQGVGSIVSQLGLFELLGSLPRLFSARKQGSTVAEYFSKIVGVDNYRRVVGPALNAVICQEAGEFPADALFRKKPRRKSVVRNFTRAGGLEAIAKAIAAQPSLQVRTGTSVSGIEKSVGGYRLRTAGGDAVEAQRLALAVSPDVAAALLRSAHPEIAELIAQVGMVEIETLAVVLRAEACGLAPLAGIIAGQDRFFSAVSRDPVPDEHYRGFSFHFRPEGLSVEAKLERICAVLEIDRTALQAVEERRNRLPALRLGHSGMVRQLDALLAGTSLALTGNWFSGVSIEDCLMRSAQECRRLLAGTA